LIQSQDLDVSTDPDSGGDTVEFEWRVDRNIAPADYPLNADGERVGVTDVSHMGPCAVYAKKVSDALTSEGPGDGWFKVSDLSINPNNSMSDTPNNRSWKMDWTPTVSFAPPDFARRMPINQPRFQ
jgi:hypothetical protein